MGYVKLIGSFPYFPLQNPKLLRTLFSGNQGTPCIILKNDPPRVLILYYRKS